MTSAATIEAVATEPTYRVRRHMPQLDGLRAIAVLCVVLAHFAPPGSITFDLGRFGVDLFFVLSGFLITGILLNDRGRSVGRSLRNFYARRIIRIFPLYYSVLLLFWLLRDPYVRQTWPWHASYLSNVFFALHGQHWGEISHLWPLSVEEQFYLLWPLLILSMPRRRILSAIFCAIGSAYAYRFLASHYGMPVLGWGSALGSFDQLATGALLAYCSRSAWWPTGHRLSLYYRLGTAIGLGMMTIPSYRNAGHALCFGAVIGGASMGFKGAVGRVLVFPPIAYVGRISYGIYMLHNFQPYIWQHVASILRIPPFPNSWMFFAVMCVMSLVAATVSWFTFEKPINNLKSRFVN